MGSCDNTGLAPCSALCLCDEHVNCATWEVMSDPDRQARNWQAEKVQLHDGYLHFLHANKKQPFVNVHSGDKGWKQKLILARHSIPVDAKEQYVFPIALCAETISALCCLNVKHTHTLTANLT